MGILFSLQSLFTKPMLRSSLCAATHNDMNKPKTLNLAKHPSNQTLY